MTVLSNCTQKSVYDTIILHCILATIKKTIMCDSKSYWTSVEQQQQPYWDVFYLTPQSFTSYLTLTSYQSNICVYRAAREPAHKIIDNTSSDTSVSVYITENVEIIV